MEHFFLSLSGYLLKVLISTLTQLSILFGPLLILAFLMNLVAGQNEKLGYRVFGRNGYLYIFGWLGTSIHELGHVFFAVIFGHKIKKINLFSPDSEDKSLGSVNHSYNPSNIYQCIGNFFIGIGPVLFGSVVLFLVTFFLFRYNIKDIISFQISTDSFSNLSSLKIIFSNIWENLLVFSGIVFTGENTAWWKILISIYLFYTIGSSITLSIADIKGALVGFLYFLALLVLFNIATLWTGDFTLDVINKAGFYLSGFYFFMLLSILVNILFILILLIFQNILPKKK